VTAVPEVPIVPEPAAEPAGVSFGTNNVSQMRATWTVPGEIGQFTGNGDAPVVAPEVPEHAVTTSPEPLNLDFNLDLELPEGDDPETQVEPREVDEPLPVVSAAPVAPAPAVSSAPLEFDLDMDPFAKQPETSAPVPHLAAEAAVDQAMQALSETDADMGIERAMDRTSLSVVDLEKTNFESSLLDFDFELGEDTNVSRSNMDLSDISLVTDAGGSVAAPAPAPAPVRHQAEVVDTSAASQAAVGTIDVHDEVSTKLELARAYEEMGDIEGARELLEEVMTDGADQQKQMAQTILSRIA
jgi:pilus assembly protein FimV